MRSTLREKLQTPLISAALALVIMNVMALNVIPVPKLIDGMLEVINTPLFWLIGSLGFEDVGSVMLFLVVLFVELFLPIWGLIYFIHDKKAFVTSKGLQIIVVVAIVGGGGVLLSQRFGLFPRQMQDLSGAERHISILRLLLQKYPRFAEVKLQADTGGKNGALVVYGSLRSEPDLRDLKRLVEVYQPPVEVVYQVQVIPAEMLSEPSKTNSASPTQ